MAMVKCPECSGDISDKAVTCPHCGFPIKTDRPKQDEYTLTKGSGQVSSISGLLRVLAVITWIGGLIVSISGANVPDGLYSTRFSFWTFVTLLLPFVLYGVIMMGLATIADQIANTNSIVSGLRLQKSDAKAAQTGAASYFARSQTGDWKCPVCGHTSHSWEETCTHCGEPKKDKKTAETAVAAKNCCPEDKNPCETDSQGFYKAAPTGFEPVFQP